MTLMTGERCWGCGLGWKAGPGVVLGCGEEEAEEEVRLGDWGEGSESRALLWASDSGCELSGRRL